MILKLILGPLFFGSYLFSVASGADSSCSPRRSGKQPRCRVEQEFRSNKRDQPTRVEADHRKVETNERRSNAETQNRQKDLASPSLEPRVHSSRQEIDNRISYYDKRGQLVASARKNNWGGYDYFDSKSKPLGASRETQNGSIEYFDSNGRRTGTVQHSDDGTENFYDNRGYPAGFSKENIYGGRDRFDANHRLVSSTRRALDSYGREVMITTRQASYEQDHLRSYTRENDPNVYTRENDPNVYTRENDPNVYTRENDPNVYTRENDPNVYTRENDPNVYTRENDPNVYTRENDPNVYTRENDPNVYTDGNNSGT